MWSQLSAAEPRGIIFSWIVTEVTMDEACEPETKQGNTYRVLVDLKALSRSIKESTEPKHRVQRYHAASVLRKASDSTDHMLELGPFDQKEYSGKPLGRRVDEHSTGGFVPHPHIHSPTNPFTLSITQSPSLGTLTPLAVLTALALFHA